MECKFKAEYISWGIFFELIDTLWNVNVKPWCVCRWAANELIDTLWNVNLAIPKPFLSLVEEN